MMDRRLLLTGAAALTLAATLSGCGGNLLGPPDAGTIYPLRPGFPAAPAGGDKVNWSLAVLRPDVPGGLDSDRIALLQPDGSMDYYAKATYPDRLPATVQRALLEGFEASGRVDAVAREEDALHADYNLLVEVRDFQAVYAVQDGVPAVMVSLNVKLTTAHGRRIIAVTTVTQKAAASVNSAGAAVAALEQALAAAVTQVVAWTLATAPPVAPGASADSVAADQTASPGRKAEQLLHDMSRGAGEKASPQ
ncbi:MAG TPA: ABC-type transport auxiliary lipoprotein family protein [Rhizomicrobium sp.]|nr:ABC-type transport auxiliary lipoprotein family protein [Rhizomicrobium sp.]